MGIFLTISLIKPKNSNCRSLNNQSPDIVWNIINKKSWACLYVNFIITKSCAHGCSCVIPNAGKHKTHPKQWFTMIYSVPLIYENKVNESGANQYLLVWDGTLLIYIFSQSLSSLHFNHNASFIHTGSL